MVRTVPAVYFLLSSSSRLPFPCNQSYMHVLLSKTIQGARAALKELVKQHGGKSVETQSSDDFVVLAEHCKVRVC